VAPPVERVPFPKLPPSLGGEWNPLRSWLLWAASKLAALSTSTPGRDLEIVVVTRATYTLTQFDQGKYLRFTQACTVTVPPAGAVPLYDGSAQLGSFRSSESGASGATIHTRAAGGVLTFTAGTGVLLVPPTGCNLNTRDGVGGVMLVCITSDKPLVDSRGTALVATLNTFDLVGDLELP